MDGSFAAGRAVAEDFLKHYGVKGMRWGVRKKSDRESASDDAVRTKGLNQRARESGRDALSNKELQDAITRMNLEQQYDRLKPRSAGEKALRFVGQQLGIIGKEQASKFARDAVGEAIKRARDARSAA